MRNIVIMPSLVNQFTAQYNGTIICFLVEINNNNATYRITHKKNQIKYGNTILIHESLKQNSK